jgi:SAM-dependent methyltransferase
VDVVTTRSVLAYVSDKNKAFQEFHRILKPGGRISIAEPVFRDDAFKIIAMRKWIEDHPEFPNLRLLRLINQWNSAQLPSTMENLSTNPLINYSERDLFSIAKESKFSEIQVELHLNSNPTVSMPWEVYIECSPHPLAPTLKEIMAQNFSLEDREFLEKAMRPVVETGQLEGIERMTYLTAIKPFA